MLRRLAIWLLNKIAGSSPPPVSNGSENRPVVRRCERCDKPRVFHISLIDRTTLRGEAHLCEECARRFLSAEVPNPGSPRVNGGGGERQVFVDKVIISEANDQQMLVFREAEGNRYLSFGLGIFEATAIDRTLRGITAPRPLTHDAWLLSITAVGASVRSGLIHDRRGETYFAELRLSRGPEIFTVDLRPSDALMVCLKAGVPFSISERLLAEVQAPME